MLGVGKERSHHVMSLARQDQNINQGLNVRYVIILEFINACKTLQILPSSPDLLHVLQLRSWHN